MPTSSADLNAIFLALGRIEGSISALNTNVMRLEGELTSLKERVTTLERTDDRSSGQWSGVKLAIGFAKQLPMGVLAFLLGKGNLS